MSEHYKDTLNLPNTSFPMKANLAEREPIILKKWDDIALYKTLLEKNAHKPKFILGDGPPYANGDIHIGHAVNKILKDMVVKSKIISGYTAAFVPGWDCHGLPIELNVEKQVGKANDKIDAKAFRQKCREYANKQIDAQRASFIRLGVLGDWFNPYKTMDYQYEADIIRSLAKITQNGHLLKGFKPVHWCVECGSALAEAEVEYQDKRSPAIDVSFYVKDVSALPWNDSQQRKDSLQFNDSLQPSKHDPHQHKIALVIWTTTPWTLPANEAVAVHPEHQYALVKIDGYEALFIVAEELVDSFVKRLRGSESEAAGYEVLTTCSGKALEGVQLQHPLYPKAVPTVLGEHVTLETGTGCVHTAPAHGPDDYELGLRYQLPFINPVGSNGCFSAQTPLFAGQHVFKANETILDTLKNNGVLLHQAVLEHSYPHCWRHKTPLIFRATQQWFVGLDQHNLRRQSLAAIQNVQWIPGWGQARMQGMIADRPDWCISRQRTWGTPLCLFLHKETGELHPETPKLMEAVAQQVETQGVDAWFDLSPETLLGSDASQYEKCLDTLDVWFEAGVSHACVLDKREELQSPADLYLEGSDQHRGWFQTSLLTSVAMKEEAPYRQVLTHGFTVDTQGRKMSKSLGNVVAPEKVVKTLGADVLRLWVAATDYRSEMAVSDEILKRTSDTYRRIRNTARFLLANMHGFDPAQHAVPAEALLALDVWIIQRARRLQAEIIKAYDEYNFHIIYQKLHNFCSIDLGSFYLDVIKDRQYTGKTEGIPRRSAQTALYHIAEALVRWMAPILSFTAEEIWENLPGPREPSVFFSEWYTQFPDVAVESELTQNEYWEAILEIRNAVNKALEEARAKGEIGSGLEAEITLYCDSELKDRLSKLEDELRFVLITSQALVESSSKKPNTAIETDIAGLWLSVVPTTYEKCVRCWHRREDVNQNTEYSGLCARCIENVKGTGEVRQYA